MSRPRFTYRRLALALVGTALLYLFVAGRIAGCAAAPLPQGQRTAHHLGDARLMEDLRALASPEMDGRRTGTPGGIKAREYVAKRLQDAGGRPLQALGGAVQPFHFRHRSIKALFKPGVPSVTERDGANVVVEFPGTQAQSPALLVSAHYDHLGQKNGALHPGADDNASGVAVVLALADVLQRAPRKHRVVLAAFDAEETGLAGSRHFVEHPPVPLQEVGLVINLDMVARSDGGEIFIAGTSSRPWLRPLAEAAAARSALRVRLGHDRPLLKAGFFQDWTMASDHGPFHQAGVPYLYLGVEDHPDYHRSTDTVEKIDPQKLLEAAELTLDLLDAADERLDQLRAAAATASR